MLYDKLKNIYAESSCLTIDELTGYKNNTLDDEKTRRVELHLASCKLCSEALLGIDYIDDEKFNELVTQINAEVKLKTEGKFFF
ncbi:MAG: hypothetical protein V1720_07410 [bacterium]